MEAERGGGAGGHRAAGGDDHRRQRPHAEHRLHRGVGGVRAGLGAGLGAGQVEGGPRELGVAGAGDRVEVGLRGGEGDDARVAGEPGEPVEPGVGVVAQRVRRLAPGLQRDRLAVRDVRDGGEQLGVHAEARRAPHRLAARAGERRLRRVEQAGQPAAAREFVGEGVVGERHARVRAARARHLGDPRRRGGQRQHHREPGGGVGLPARRRALTGGRVVGSRVRRGVGAAPLPRLVAAGRGGRGARHVVDRQQRPRVVEARRTGAAGAAVDVDEQRVDAVLGELEVGAGAPRDGPRGHGDAEARGGAGRERAGDALELADDRKGLLGPRERAAHRVGVGEPGAALEADVDARDGLVADVGDRARDRHRGDPGVRAPSPAGAEDLGGHRVDGDARVAGRRVRDVARGRGLVGGDGRRRRRDRGEREAGERSGQGEGADGPDARGPAARAPRPPPHEPDSSGADVVRPRPSSSRGRRRAGSTTWAASGSGVRPAASSRMSGGSSARAASTSRRSSV